MPEQDETQWQRVKRNPTLHENALLSEQEGEKFPWHGHADLPQSSQTFCVSAFGTLRTLSRKDHVLSAFLLENFPPLAVRGRPRSWHIELEASCRELLGEHGPNQPTSIDALCISSKEVVCIESKFIVDAAHGLGGCSHAANGLCKGFFGPVSDARTNTSAWCRLETWDGKRSPRLYWALGRQYFQPSVFAQQGEGQECPLKGPNYQMMRNFLFAAAQAERDHKPFFGALVVAPRQTSGLLEEQVRRFRTHVLLPKFRERVALAHYEEYIAILKRQKDERADELAGFLQRRMEALQIAF